MKKIYKLIIVFMFCMAVTQTSAWAVQVAIGDAPANTAPAVAMDLGELPVKVEVMTDAASPQVGDTISVTVRVTARPDVILEPMAYPKTLGDWDVLAVRHIGMETSERQRQRVDQIDVQTFLPGDVEIPALVQKYRTADQQPGEFRSASITVKVAPLPMKKTDKPGTIRGLKQPQGMFSWWWAGLIGGIILLLAALVGVWMYRQGKTIMDMRPKAPPKPAHQTALERLDALRQSALLAQAQYKVYYIELSDILRRYIEMRFHIAATDMTTYELIRALKSKDAKTQDTAVVRNVLSQSDMVKFAKLLPNAQDAGTDWQSVRDMVVRTAEIDETSPSPAGEGEAS